jgi:hypothetical protein
VPANPGLFRNEFHNLPVIRRLGAAPSTMGSEQA